MKSELHSKNHSVSVIDDPVNSKRVRFFLCNGSNHASITSSRDLAAELKQRTYQVTALETGGTHGWPSFRRCFADFAQGAFQNQATR